LHKPGLIFGDKGDIPKLKFTAVTKLSFSGHSPAQKLGRLPGNFRKKVFFSKDGY
jgi:hypothetical protein